MMQLAGTVDRQHISVFVHLIRALRVHGLAALGVRNGGLGLAAIDYRGVAANVVHGKDVDLDAVVQMAALLV
jgi:hypothetical protein